MKKILIPLLAALTFTINASAANYVVDDKGAHAFINFKIKHLGFSWLTGRFNTFTGTFNYDGDASKSKINIDIDPASIDSNHAKRDKHLRDPDFLDVAKFKTAKFTSTKITDKGDNKLEVIGNLTLRGITKSINIDAVKIGEGKDPWGGYRAGFSGTTTLVLKDFNFPDKLGPASAKIEMELHIEGIRQ